MTADDVSSTLRQRFSYLPSQPKKDYGSAAAYCEEVRKAIEPYQAAKTLYQEALREYQEAQIRAQIPRVPTINAPRGLHISNVHVQIQQRNGGAYIQTPNGVRSVSNIYRPAPLLKRVVAELIDFFIFFLFKVIAVYFLIDYLEVIDLAEYEKLLGNQADLQSLIDITQYLFPYELFCKLLITLFEACCIRYHMIPGLPFTGTPGKILVGIRVISAKTVIQSNVLPGQLTVIGFEQIPFRHALLRSLVKNVFINSLLPLSTVAFAFNNHRSVYDIMSSTLVVEGRL